MSTNKTEGQPAPTTGGDFGALLADLDTLTKSMPAGGDDAGADGSDNPDGGADGTDGDEDGDEEMFGKALKVTTADGTVVDALDGETMLKALRHLRGKNRSLGETVAGQAALLTDSHAAIEHLTTFAKSMKAVVDGQATLIKSLQDKVAELGGQGRGRASRLTVLDKGITAPAGAAAAQPTGASRQEILTKALALSGAGRITSADVGMIEGCLNNGASIPAHLVAALQG